MDARAVTKTALHNALLYWTDFVDRCIANRLETSQFEPFVRVVYSKHHLPAIAITDLLLRPRSSNSESLDPRIPPYIQTLTRLGYIDTPSILNALYDYSSSHRYTRSRKPTVDGAEDDDHRTGEEGKAGDTQGVSNNGHRADGSPLWDNSYWAEEVIFYALTKAVVEGRAVQDTKTALEVVKSISKWMSLFTAASSPLSADILAQQKAAKARDDMESARAGFVALLLRLCESPIIYKAISKPHAKGSRKELADGLASFAPTLQLVPQIMEKLELFRTDTLAKLDPVSKKKDVDGVTMDDLFDSAVGLSNFVVSDVPISNTRAGLYIYLNALLIGKPLIDDAALFNYLNNRYQGDAQNSSIDLILASFDMLAIAVFRSEGPQDAHLLRSFVTNKLPLLLCQLCPPGFGDNSGEFRISQALNQVDTSLFPTASLMFDESRNNNPYTESIREEFCLACVLHGLINRDHVNSVLGEAISFEPSSEKYLKDKLVQESIADPEKIKSLVGDLEKMDGNVGAVSQAIVEIIRQLCQNKETMSLKLVCSQLAQKPQFLDVLLLFEKLPNITGPLCQLLDDWHYEEDQGEYQPVFEDFGAVLLLVLAFAYRYGLTAVDLGIQNANSCVAKILSRGHVARQQEELAEKEKTHLNGWIHGLFDSEAGGLGDDLMSSCPPQEFYLIVASLFQNIVTAYSHGYLTDDSLKSGVEYLIDTFLLPSLVPAIRFLSDYLWVDQKEQKSIIKILQLILLPTSISGEASAMLSSVKNLVAKPLEHALRTYQKREPKNQDIEPLLKTLSDSLILSRRTGGAEHKLLEQWSSSPSSGLPSAIKHALQGLVQWSLQPALNVMPTAYTQRLMKAGQKVLGARRVLYIILEEIRQQTETGNASLIYDVATALVCAPTMAGEQAPHAPVDESGSAAPAQQRVLTLREVLAAEAEDCMKIQKTDAALAENIVRLYRRVEVQSTMPQAPPMLAGGDMTLGLDGNAAALGDAMAPASVTGDGMRGMDGVDLGMPLGDDLGLGGDQSLGAGGGLDAGASDTDLFGLDTNMDDFDWGDSMDLS